jgi:hypothetical protein
MREMTGQEDMENIIGKRRLRGWDNWDMLFAWMSIEEPNRSCLRILGKVK